MTDQKPSVAEIIAEPNVHPNFDAFVATVAALRAPDGCPWDKEQTHTSISQNMIEEAYEAVDAIEANDVAHMREELGDVLLQVLLHSQIAEDAGEFTIDDVCKEVNDKIVRRHPHVFGNLEAGDANEVLAVWDQIKLQEKQEAEPKDISKRPSLLDGVPKSFPALLQAQKISRKAVSAGFEWDTLDDIWGQVNEEIAELKAAYEKAPKSPNGKMKGETPEHAAAEMEFGDVLFALVNVARRMGIDAEAALRASCTKFRSRWAHMEQDAWAEGVEVEEVEREQLEELWRKAKAAE